jgi:ParB/RepB/Spo0J family partition protein
LQEGSVTKQTEKRTTEFAPYETMEVQIDRIDVRPDGRELNDDASHAELVESIAQYSLLQPVVVSKAGPRFLLLAGRRRLAAVKKLAWKSVPATVVEGVDTPDGLRAIEIVENLHRRDLTILDECRLFTEMTSGLKMSVQQVGDKIGRSAVYVYDRLRLANLVQSARGLLSDGRITPAHAIILSRQDKKVQDDLLHIHADGRHGALWTRDEGSLFDSGEKATERFKAVSVKELQAWVDKHVRLAASEAANAMLYPELHKAVLDSTDVDATDTEPAYRMVPITEEHFVAESARDQKERTYGPASWKQTKTLCPTSRTKGWIAAGRHRGQTFWVCIEKLKCKAHWGAEIRSKQKSAKDRAVGKDSQAAEREQKERERRDREMQEIRQQRESWIKALPDIAEAVANRVKSAPAATVIKLCSVYANPDAGRYAKELMPEPKTADAAVRRIAFLTVMDRMTGYSSWQTGVKEARRALALDVAPIVKKHTPAPAQAPEQPKKKAAKKGGR